MTEESRNTPNTYERRIDGYARILKKQLGEDRQIVCVLVAFAGMFFVSGVMTGRLPQLGEAKGIFFAFLGAVFYASSTLLNKKMPPVDSITKTIYQFTLAAVVLLPYVLLKHDICPYA